MSILSSKPRSTAPASRFRTGLELPNGRLALAFTAILCLSLSVGVYANTTAPSAPTSVDVSPTSPRTRDTLTATASGSVDPEGDPLTYEYQWAKSLDGTTWGAWGNDGQTLNPDLTTKGEYWKAQGRAFDGTYYGGWTESSPVVIVNTPPQVDWRGTLGLVNDGVDPEPGYPWATTLNFQCVVSDPDGTAPATMNAVVSRVADGRAWDQYVLPLGFVSGTWSEGAILSASTMLSNGSWVHRFDIIDDEGAAGEGPAAIGARGPAMRAAPQLWTTGLPGREDDYIHPNTGVALDTQFRFAVQYTDGEGSPPTQRRIDIQKKRPDGSWRAYDVSVMKAWGGTPRGGKFYTYKRVLHEGEYRYRFVFADYNGSATGTDSNWADATQWQEGLIVTAPPAPAAGTAVSLTSVAAAPAPAGAQVSFTLSGPATVQARIMNMAGRTVRALCRAQQCDAGMTVLVWNGQADSGTTAPNGAYLVEIAAAGADGSRARAVRQLRLAR